MRSPDSISKFVADDERSWNTPLLFSSSVELYVNVCCCCFGDISLIYCRFDVKNQDNTLRVIKDSINVTKR